MGEQVRGRAAGDLPRERQGLWRGAPRGPAQGGGVLVTWQGFPWSGKAGPQKSLYWAGQMMVRPRPLQDHWEWTVAVAGSQPSLTLLTGPEPSSRGSPSGPRISRALQGSGGGHVEVEGLP